jgi:hypothetical protein
VKKQEYSEEELIKISEEWKTQKAKIDSDNIGVYHYDLDRIYERVLSNENLRVLFRHAAYLYRGLHEGGLVIYAGEQKLIVEVYRGILQNGYYSKNRAEEKRVRAHLGKAVSRQYYHKLKK